MIDEISGLLDKYVSWLKDNTSLRQLDGWVEITTPYADRHNDLLQIYVKRLESGYLLTDDGYVIRDLEQSGEPLDSPKRKALLNMVLNGFGVQLEDRRLEVRASANNFAIRKHALIQAMLSVSDLFYLARPYVASLFFEDVVSWLELSDIRYSPQVVFTGKTGYNHKFDFVIPKSRTKPERIVNAITHPNKDSAMSMAFAWLDTRDVRPAGSRAFAVLNDSDRPVPLDVIDALRNYDVSTVAWSERESIREEFAS